MDDILRKRLTDEERDAYDGYDRWASIAAHFAVWPGIAGLISYAGGRLGSAMVCAAFVLVAMPIVIYMGKQASKIRQLAENRFAAIMGEDGKAASDEPNP